MYTQISFKPSLVKGLMLHAPESFFNNRMVTVTLAPEAFKVGSKVWVRYLGVIKGHPEGFAIRDGLCRPGGAFFQTGFGYAL